MDSLIEVAGKLCSAHDPDCLIDLKCTCVMMCDFTKSISIRETVLVIARLQTVGSVFGWQFRQR